MKRLDRFAEGLPESLDLEKLIQESEELYEDFATYCLATDFGEKIYEGKIKAALEKALDFVKTIAIEAALKVSDLLKVLLNKTVFALFNWLGWSPADVKSFLKWGIDLWKQVANFLPDLATSLAMKGLKGLSKTEFGKRAQEVTACIEDWLNKHPVIKKLSGVALAAGLLLIWVNMSFTGDFDSDFDLSDVFAALTGTLTITAFLTSENGVKTIILLVSGLLGLTFPWFSTPISITVALVKTLAKYLGVKVKAARDQKDIDQQLQMALA